MDGCPTTDELRAFAVGRLPAAAREAAARHVEGCAACLAALDQLQDPDDPLLADLRRTVPADVFTERDRPPRWAERVQGAGATAGAGTTRSRGAHPGPAGGVGRDDGLPAVPGYDVLGELGRGGMGAVYRARQRGLNRTVALKMILAGACAGPPELARFHTEAEAAARLQHPNIVQIYQIARHDGRPYLALEYVEGRDLAHALAGTPWSPARAARLVEALAQAIHYAHGQGVVHRDLKPANVLLTADGTPKITDFGLAKIVDGGGTLTRSGAIMGTPCYMAPEQAAGRPSAVGPATDVWALGAILYELLTGRPPFQGETAEETLQQVQTQEPVSPSRLRPQVPQDLAAVCLKCLAKEPPGRYPSAEELAEDLRRFQAGEPVQARPAGRAERLWRWCRRNPTVAWLLAVVALLVVAIALVSVFALPRHGTAPAGTPDAERPTPSRQAEAVAGRDRPEELEDVPGVPPPEGAVVLFDGKGLGNWSTVDHQPARWEVLPGGIVQARGGNIVTNQSFGGHFRLHVEFRVPYMPRATGQARGNSGVYVQGRYEVQILDSYGQKSTRWDCGAICGVAAPRVNACKAPLVWQSYDVDFTALKCAGGKITEPARMTVYHNGVPIHDDVKLVDREGRPLTRTMEGLDGDPCRPGPILLQEYGSPVRFRNLWLLPLKE